MVPERHRALAARRPAAPAERLQTEPVLVAGEDLDGLLRVALGFLRDRRGEFILNASRSSAVAACGCRGRGTWMVRPIARSASQPRCGATFSRPRAPAIQAATSGTVWPCANNQITW
jgi:hypothetical protein